MKRLFVLFVVLIIISGVFAKCDDGQIDLNSASLEEMMKITGLGGKGVIAQRVIDSRSFDCVDDLINVKGIGENILDKIQEQGLACVGENVEEIEDNNESEKEIGRTQELDLIKKETNESKNIELNVIKLNTKNIKTEDNNENLDKTNYAKYGFVIFCTLLGFLFMFKKRKYKTEFDK